jgi:competence protein CoiA
MLTSISDSTQKRIHCKDAQKSDGLFTCPACGSETILKKGTIKAPHFAHKPPTSCEYGKGESEEHRRAKQSIYDALQERPGVDSLELEKYFGRVIADVFFVVNQKQIAIEVQVSKLDLKRIAQRTLEYTRLGVYVLWLPIFSEPLEEPFYAPKIWEKWLHTVYFGKVYYWVEGLKVCPISYKAIKEYVGMNAYGGGGYTRTFKRDKELNREPILDILDDFRPTSRTAWSGGGLSVPDCKILVAK